MTKDFNMLFNNIQPYVQQSPSIDMVQSKFGLVFVESISSDDVVASIVQSFDDLLLILFAEIESDISEKNGWRHTTMEDAPEMRRRILPYLNGLPNEQEAREQIELLIAEHLSQ